MATQCPIPFGGVVEMQDMFNTCEAAKYVSLASVTLERMRITGEGPAFVRLGRSVRYRRADLENWINGRLLRSTSEVIAS
jgi:excisionase family DNA binding protein